MDINLIEIGKFAKRKRKEKGWNQEYAAKRIYTFRQAISNIECGKTIGQLDVFLRYMSELNICLTPSIRNAPAFDDLKTLFPEDD